MADFDFEAGDVGSDYTLLPPGEYVVQIIGDEMKPNNNRNGSYLKIEHEILEGDYKGSRIFNQLNLDNPNEQAVTIARQSMSQICVAIGKTSIRKTEELHYRPLIARVAVKEPEKDENGNTKINPNNGKPYTAQNQIKRYLPIDGRSAPAQQQRTAAPAQRVSAPPPRAAAPSAQQPAPGAAAPAVAATGNKPWNRPR